ncbi:hypothetical protein PSA7680_02539 [Pseudoruegeria aquimaris]|uniref:DUF393 domain-containing protein n=1 Tax=Pseudoruegeria aquimaris TaxID=393663 RepID=A0A1Y5T003_9RHOB|nr:DUF393 domain-containing protein [Pseudoruegeria aquimaris]SLN48936.1 hypothetical protein PSA7680_02539 [Pseudoruegeria aquimaris]
MPEQTEILYNADCPVCNFEITHYADYARKEALPLTFKDLNRDDFAAFGLTADQAARRLHVLKDGQITAGIPAFLILWREMPRYRWLAKLVALPGLFQLSCFGYDRILAPLIYRWHLRRLKRRAAAGAAQPGRPRP